MGQIILRGGAVIVVDDSATDYTSVKINLDGAIEMLRAQNVIDMIYVMANSAPTIGSDDARELAQYYHDQAPTGGQVYMIHHDDWRMIELADAALDQFARNGRRSYALRTTLEARELMQTQQRRDE